MKVLIFLMALLSFQMFSQTTVTKYRINFKEIKKNLEKVKTQFTAVEDHSDSYKPISQTTISNFYVFLELGERIEGITFKESSKRDEEKTLEDLALTIDQIKLTPYQTEQAIKGLENLLEIFKEIDVIHLEDEMAIKLIDNDLSTEEKNSYERLRFKRLKNVLRASGGVSSGGGGA